MTSNLHTWACLQMDNLGLPEPKEIVAYLIGLDNAEDVESYLKDLLDLSNINHRNFIADFIRKWKETRRPNNSGFYRKPDINNGSLKPNIKEKNLIAKDNVGGSEKSHTSGKKKSKFVSLYSEEGYGKDVILLPGRHKCDCQASKHLLINNCTKCGRIVCEQEGSGPCAFCGNLVMSAEEKEVINRGSKKSEALHNRLINSKKIMDEEGRPLSKGLQKALEHRNKLLEYDKTSERRTRVYDDESDYFQSSSKWISPADRQKLEQREEELRNEKYSKNRKVTVDLLGRKIIPDKESIVYDPNDPIVKKILEDVDSVNVNSIESINNVFPRLNFSRPEYLESDEPEHINQSSFQGALYRIQDRELQEMRDEGMCLSMHQPWASLLVAGIKIHEGRSWYSPHRGRLWIASAAKVPMREETDQIESFYKSRKTGLTFPKHYPTGCLLGCVNLTDVLPQEEYRDLYPDGESESPYVFICENPVEMVVKFPIKGQHKLFKIDSKIHKAAQKSLRDL